MTPDLSGRYEIYVRPYPDIEADVSSDGARFLLIRDPDPTDPATAEASNDDSQSRAPQLILVQNWSTEIERLAPRD